jgi:hypothetical protein
MMSRDRTGDRFIGYIDLTVRLSSMNPHKILDVGKANDTFIKKLFDATLHTMVASRHPERLTKYGILKVQLNAPFFEFEFFDDLVNFLSRLRFSLMNEGLPFKAVIRRGELGGNTLREKWESTVEKVEKGTAERGVLEEAKMALASIFEARSNTQIRELFSLCRGDQLDISSVVLHADFEGFKGTGLYFNPNDEDFLEKQKSNQLISNYFPLLKGKVVEYSFYLDLPLKGVEELLITRCAIVTTSTKKEKFLSSPRRCSDRAQEFASVFKEVQNLFHRSVLSRPQDGAFFISFFTLLIQSSDFSQMTYISKEAEAEALENTDVEKEVLVSGWQNYPIMFESVFLDTSFEKELFEVPGRCLIFGLLFARILHARRTGMEGMPSDKDLRNDIVIRQLVKIFKSMRRRKLLRDVLALPNDIVSEDCKRILVMR